MRRLFEWLYNFIAPDRGKMFWSAKSPDNLEKFWASLLNPDGDNDAGKR